MKTNLTCDSCILRSNREKYELKLALPTKTPCPANEQLCSFYQVEQKEHCTADSDCRKFGCQ